MKERRRGVKDRKLGSDLWTQVWGRKDGQQERRVGGWCRRGVNEGGE